MEAEDVALTIVRKQKHYEGLHVPEVVSELDRSARDKYLAVAEAVITEHFTEPRGPAPTSGTVIMSRDQVHSLNELASEMHDRTLEVDREYANDENRTIRVHLDRYDVGARCYIISRDGHYELDMEA